MLRGSASMGIKPVNVAELMSVVSATTKSSAVSVWIDVAVAGRDRVAIFPSGLPVEKEKIEAEPRDASSRKASAPTLVLLAQSADRTSEPSRRRVGVGFIVFIL